MKVSIIIPAYNVERYIEKCLNSAIRQTFDHSQYEIIVINDNSTDKTLNVINKFLKKFNNLIVLNNKKTQGPGISRNKALRFSKGKYIFFLDSDDFIDLDALEVLYKKALQNNADVVGYNFSRIKNNKYTHKCRKDINKITIGKKKIIKNFLYNEMDGSVIYSFIKKKVISENNIKFKKGVHEDILFIFKIYFYSNKIIKYNRDLYFKINRQTSILNNFTIYRILDLLKAFKDVYIFLNKKNKRLGKKYHKIYIRGLVGCVGTFLIQNFKYSLKKKKIAYKNYTIVYKSIKNDFKNVILPYVTFRDKITEAFFEEFSKTKNTRKSIINYENRYKKIELLKH